MTSRSSSWFAADHYIAELSLLHTGEFDVGRVQNRGGRVTGRDFSGTTAAADAKMARILCGSISSSRYGTRPQRGASNQPRSVPGPTPDKRRAVNTVIGPGLRRRTVAGVPVLI